MLHHILLKRCSSAVLNGAVDAYRRLSYDVKEEEDWCLAWGWREHIPFLALLPVKLTLPKHFSYSRDARDVLSQPGLHFSFTAATLPCFRRPCPSSVPPEKCLTKPLPRSTFKIPGSSNTSAIHEKLEPWVYYNPGATTHKCIHITHSDLDRSSQCEGQTLHSGVSRVSRVNRRHSPLCQDLSLQILEYSTRFQDNFRLTQFVFP